MQEQASGTEGDVITLNLGWRPGIPRPPAAMPAMCTRTARAGARHPGRGAGRGRNPPAERGERHRSGSGGGRWQVTTDGGKPTRWSSDQRRQRRHGDQGDGPEPGQRRPGPEERHHPSRCEPGKRRPVNVLPDDPQVAQEDEPFVIQGLQVKDVDAGNSIMEVRLSVEHGTLTLPAGKRRDPDRQRYRRCGADRHAGGSQCPVLGRRHPSGRPGLPWQ